MPGKLQMFTHTRTLTQAKVSIQQPNNYSVDMHCEKNGTVHNEQSTACHSNITQVQWWVKHVEAYVNDSMGAFRVFSLAWLDSCICISLTETSLRSWSGVKWESSEFCSHLHIHLLHHAISFKMIPLSHVRIVFMSWVYSHCSAIITIGIFFAHWLVLCGVNSKESWQKRRFIYHIKLYLWMNEWMATI